MIQYKFSLQEKNEIDQDYSNSISTENEEKQSHQTYLNI